MLTNIQMVLRVRDISISIHTMAKSTKRELVYPAKSSIRDFYKPANRVDQFIEDCLLVKEGSFVNSVELAKEYRRYNHLCTMGTQDLYKKVGALEGVKKHGTTWYNLKLYTIPLGKRLAVEKLEEKNAWRYI